MRAKLLQQMLLGTNRRDYSKRLRQHVSTVDQFQADGSRSMTR